MVEETTSAEEITARGLRFTRYASVEDAYKPLLDGDIGAVVHERPLLRWVAVREFGSEVRVLEGAIGRQDYGVALPQDTQLREAINQALLHYLRSPRWTEMQNRYLRDT